jgi:uncharacterized OsmC-like protein
VAVGFKAIKVKFDIVASEATPQQLAGLKEKTEQYCVVMQTLTQPPTLDVSWKSIDGSLEP